MSVNGSVGFVVMPRPWAPSDVFGRWAAEREAEGWDGVAIGDHWFLEGSGGCAHAFVVLAHAAASTSSIGLSTSFANNLFRTPVELAQAALTLQLVSGGRFELGVGAGWAQQELIGAGLDHPEPAVRVRRLREAVCIVRALLAGGCQFNGEFYRVDLPAAGIAVESPPRLSAALGGPVSMRVIGPLVDRIELATMGVAFRDGRSDMRAFAWTTRSDLQRLIDLAHDANPAAPITLALYVAPGSGPAVDHFESVYAGSCYEGLAGPPGRVADAIRGFTDLEIDRINVMPPIGGVRELAPLLLDDNG